MKNGRLHHFGNICAVKRRAGIQRIAGGKTDLVIDNDVNRTTRTVASDLAQLHALHYHALSGKSGIAMHDNW